MSQRRLHLLALVALIVLTLTSCTVFRRPAPQPRPEQQGGFPAIPEPIAQGERQEPTLRVYMHETGEIKEMKFEEYIAGVVAAEMEPTWHEEALAAQAILARTFTLEKIARQGGVPERNAHASTNIEEFQAYDASRVNEDVRQAVERTRGEVATYEGRYIRAWFHANSGGRTANALEGLAFDREPTPYVASVEDAISVEAAPDEQVNWEESFTKQQIRAAMQSIGRDPGNFQTVEIVERGPSGRATKVRVGQATVSAPALRLAIGSTRMRSTFFDSIEAQGDRITFSGKGYGHGVGMSQWGAKGRAERGDSAEDIVRAYFKDIKIQKVWE